nr:GntR family transcriptional regulator [Deinobacterium chartae]
MQITHQLKHLIISRKLPEGSRLPPVRELAKQLGVNVGTVVQAYRELRRDGLIDGQPGRGTQVKPFSVPQADYSRRQALLSAEIDRLAQRARSLGFSPAELHQLVGMQLSRPPGPMRVLFIGPIQAAADKYAAMLQQAFLPQDVVFEGFALGTLEARDPAVIQALEIAYYVVTLALWVPATRRALERHALPATVLGITAELTARTLEQLHALDPAGQYVVLTEERNVNTALALIEQHGALHHDRVRAVVDTQPETLARLLPEVNAVIYSFGVRPTLEAVGVPPEKRLELEFEVSQESLFRLHSVLTPASLALAD